MSKLKSVVVAFLGLSMFMVTPAAFPQGNEGCKNGKFIGSYTTLFTFTDVWSDGSNVEHQLINQLNLHSDGTLTDDNAGGPDLMLSFGLSTTGVGSWTCRSDGKLVVTFIIAVYEPTTDAKNHPASVPDPPPVDMEIFRHIRRTILFSVTDANTLTQTQSRDRNYDPTQDPTDPTGGVLGPLVTDEVAYKRLVASDADLLAP